MHNQFLLHDLGGAAPALPPMPESCFIFAALPAVRHCVGCFGCWTKTPGQCVIQDRCAAALTQLATTGELVIVSRLVYGGFSPAVKAVLDRSIGYLLPYFRTVGGEMHHSMRYKNSFRLTVHFYGEAPARQRAIAQQLVAANATNMGAGEPRAFFYASAAAICPRGGK